MPDLVHDSDCSLHNEPAYPADDRGSFYRYLFETEEKARSFAGHWKGEIVKVEVRPLVFFEKSGDRDFR